MKLTKRQFKLLKFYSKYQTEPLTLFKIARAFWLAWILLLLAPAFGWWYIQAGLPALGWVFVGTGIGAFLRDINRILSLFFTWPVLHEIINWERLEFLIQEKEKYDAKSPTE
jgi:hypothetical protein